MTWWRTDQQCPKCARPVLRTRSGTQMLCSNSACGWYTETPHGTPNGGPSLAECVARFDTVPQFEAPTPVPAAVWQARDTMRAEAQAPIAPPSCRHAKLRAANGGTCPRGCP